MSRISVVIVVVVFLSPSAWPAATKAKELFAARDSAAESTLQGSIVAWGNNSYGQAEIPSSNSHFVSVAAGYRGSVGLKADGSLVSWGRSYVSEITSEFIAIAAGGTHTLGLKSDGSIVGWGDNSAGQINVPLPNAEFVAVAAGDYHSLGLKEDGSIVAWGSWDQTDIPPPNSGFVAIAAGGKQSLGLKADGSITIWGCRSVICEFDGPCHCTEVDPPPWPNSDFIGIAAGERHCLGLRSDGSIVAWGEGGPAQFALPAHNYGFISIAAGGHHGLALRPNGSIEAWGCEYSGDYGQCNIPAPNSGFVAVAAGFDHSLALKAIPNGDFDLDGYVDFADAKAFNACQAGPQMIPTPRPPLTTARCLGVFDIVRDGRLDLADFADMQNVFAASGS